MDEEQNMIMQQWGRLSHPDPIRTDIRSTIICDDIHHVIEFVFEVVLQGASVQCLRCGPFESLQ